MAEEKRVDVKKLVVSQQVFMVSNEIYFNWGTVTKVTPEGVEVEGVHHGLISFDNEGNETDVSRRNRLGFGPSPESKFHTVLWYAAPEFQPWHLVEPTDSDKEIARKWRERTKS